MTPEVREAYDAMLAALKQCTSRADDDLKKYFRSRTDECQRDYAQCIDAIAKAEAALTAPDKNGDSVAEPAHHSTEATVGAIRECKEARPMTVVRAVGTASTLASTNKDS